MESDLWGIDFGACNIKISRYSNGKVKPLKLSKVQKEGNQLSNVVYYGPEQNGEHEILLGLPAQNKLDPINTIRNVKTKFVRNEWKINIPNIGKDVGADEVIADIFVELARIICEKKGENDIQLATVLTVPVCFSSIQKHKLYSIAKAAGFDVKGVITEPFAALFAEEDFTEDLKTPQTVLIYDFGGSTMDVSVVKLSKRDGKVVVEEKVANGLFFGGLNIDRDILENIFKVKYKTEWDTIMLADGEDIALPNFLSQIENAKRYLFDGDDEKEDFYYTSQNGKLYSFELWRNDLEEMFANLHYGEKLCKLLDDLFVECDDLRKNDVTQVHIYGGSCKIDYFLKTLSDYFGTDVFDYTDCEFDDDIYMAVSAGAARYLQIITNEVKNFDIRNVVPFAVGLRRNGNKFYPLINKNEVYGLEKPKKVFRKFVITGSKLEFFQRFQRLSSGLNVDDNGLIYVGSLTVNERKVSGLDGLMFTVMLRGDDSLLVRFYRQPNLGEEPIEVDSAVLQLGE